MRPFGSSLFVLGKCAIWVVLASHFRTRVGRRSPEAKFQLASGLDHREGPLLFVRSSIIPIGPGKFYSLRGVLQVVILQSIM